MWLVSFGISAGAENSILKMKLEYENLGDSSLLGEHPGIVNNLLGPVTVHYREVLLYTCTFIWSYTNTITLN